MSSDKIDIEIGEKKMQIRFFRKMSAIMWKFYQKEKPEYNIWKLAICICYPGGKYIGTWKYLLCTLPTNFKILFGFLATNKKGYEKVSFVFWRQI